VKLEIMDVPSLERMDKGTKEFMSALASTSNFNLFNAVPIRLLIDYLFEPVRDYTIKWLLIPYALFLFVYDLYGNILINYEVSQN
jgi:hypothetical protein